MMGLASGVVFDQASWLKAQGAGNDSFTVCEAFDEADRISDPRRLPKNSKWYAGKQCLCHLRPLLCCKC